jgi:deoxyribose-phosphate aldolase
VTDDDAAVARRAIELLDLTDLAGDTTVAAVDVLCERAAAARTAAVCVWPAFVEQCARRLAGTGVLVATVVNFPAGTDPAERVRTMTASVLAAGADEVDVVLPYTAWLAGDTEAAVDVLSVVRQEVAERTLKVIIESGELPEPSAIDRAAMLAIECGADFVKTSTGKTRVSATLEAAEIILEAISVSGRPVGLKASGGIRTVADARAYLELADRIMGPGWVSPATFRFGASSLLDALEAAVAGA